MTISKETNDYYVYLVDLGDKPYHARKMVIDERGEDPLSVRRA